jgi:hypothetical protein
MYTPYVRISSGNVKTTLDATAKNVVGSIYSPPANLNLPLSTVGLGAQPVYKYVYYNSTTNPTPVAASAPVYYTDESFTTVSGNAAEAFFTTDGACIAGYLQPNTTSLSTFTAAQLNQSYCFIQIGGLATGVYAPTTTTSAGVPNPIGGLTTGNWTSVVNTTLAAGSRLLGIQWTAIASSACDVLMGGIGMFWGS